METLDATDKPTTLVSFRIFDSQLDPDYVSQIVGLIPDHKHRKGDYLHNDPKYSPAKYGMWSLRSKLSTEAPLPAHLEGLLAILEPKRELILKLSEQNSIDFLCSLYSQNGFQLDPHLMKRIANLGAALGVTVYPP